MTTGWTCPKCGRVWGPQNMGCKPCNDVATGWASEATAPTVHTKSYVGAPELTESSARWREEAMAARKLLTGEGDPIRFVPAGCLGEAARQLAYRDARAKNGEAE